MEANGGNGLEWSQEKMSMVENVYYYKWGKFSKLCDAA